MGHQGTIQRAFVPAKSCSSEIRVGIFGYVCMFFNYDCALERMSSRIESLQIYRSIDLVFLQYPDELRLSGFPRSF